MSTPLKSKPVVSPPTSSDTSIRLAPPLTTTTTAMPSTTANPPPSLRSTSIGSTRAPTTTTTGAAAAAIGTGPGAGGDRTDALWAEMQATLEAVELSAGGGGARVFSPDHERKLEDLRAAQIALAQAWARSEADEAMETTTSGVAVVAAATATAAGAGDGGGGGGGVEGKSVLSTDAVAAAVAATGGKSTHTAGTGSVRPASGAGGEGSGNGQQRPRSTAGGMMEEETEADILLARKRREANDRYFQRVSQGVLDVVAKLEEVAISMREVEQASKELWGEDQEGGSSVKA